MEVPGITITRLPSPTGVPGRFWVLGPVEFKHGSSEYSWGVVDGHDLPGQRKAPKPAGYREFWPTEAEANAHRDALNEEHPA